MAIGDSPTGPFKALDEFVFDIRNQDGTLASGEDPFVWYHQGHEKFYAVLKDFTGKITNKQPGLALMQSLDGIKWETASNPFFMKKEVLLSSGESLKVNRLERPQLLTDEQGNPLVLYAACALVELGKRKDGVSFNVHIPLQ